MIFVNGAVTLPSETDRHESLRKCVSNISYTYARNQTLIYMSEEVEDSDFMDSLVSTIDIPRKILSPNNLTNEQGFFLLLAQKNKFYSKILERMTSFSNSYFVLVWVDPDPSILHIRSIFQEFWKFEVLDVVALVQMRYGGISVYTYFPYTKTQCADSGAPISIDTWSTYYNQFRRKTDLFSKKNKIYNLYGCTLRCAGVHRPPDSVIRETGNKTYAFDGIGGLLFKTIVEKLNFTPVITKVTDMTTNYETTYSNDSSVIAIEVATKRVDLGFGLFTRLTDYHPEILFVKETNMDCFTWAVPASAGQGPSMWTTYVGEFSAVTWCIITSSVSLAILYFYFLSFTTAHENKSFKNWEFLTFFVYYTFLGVSQKKPQSNVLRMFYLPWLFYCLVLVAAYNAQLGSFATIPTKTGNIETVADLVQTKFSISGTTQMFRVLNASTNASNNVKSLLKRFEVLPPGKFHPAVDKIVIERDTAVFSSKNLFKYFNEQLKTHNKPTCYVQPTCLVKSPTTPMIVHGNSALKEPLSMIIRRLFESGKN